MGRVRIPILMYHSISPSATPKFRRYTVSPAAFSAQVTYLKDNGYTSMTLSGLRSALDSRRALPHRPIVLTFDDGFADFYTDAVPVLLAAGFTATVYIVAGLTGRTSEWLRSDGEGSRDLLTWSQVRELDGYGVEIGSHTHTHPDLDFVSHVDANWEITESKRCIEENIGHAVTSFAYPHGSYSPAVKQMVREAGYISACAVKNRFSMPTEDSFSVSRLEVHAGIGIEAFGTLIEKPGVSLRTYLPESLHTGIRRVIRRLDHVKNEGQQDAQDASVDM